MSDSPAETTPSPGRAPWLVAAAVFAVVLAYLSVRDIGVPIYDDGYFFKRFALNFLEHGVFAWNLEDGPVHGSTSQAFQLLATLATSIAATHYVVVIKLFSALALAGLAAVVMRWSSRTEAAGRGPVIALLGLGCPLVLTTALTGMETAATLLALALVLTAMVEPDGRMRMTPSKAALCTVALYLFRPDAALIPAVVVVVPALLRRELPMRYFVWLAGLMTVTLAGLWAYYGTPLPLSFFMKTSGLQPYGAHLTTLGLGQKQLHFGATVIFAAPLVWLAVHRRDPANLALLGATAALWGYHLLLTNEIMGYRGRFYVPGLVPLCLAAVRGDAAHQERGRPMVALGMLVVLGAVITVAYLRKWIPTPADDFLGRIAWSSYLGLIVGGAWLLRPGKRVRPVFEQGVMGAIMLVAVLGWKPPVQFRMRSDAWLMRVHARQVTTVRGVFDIARCMPEAKNVYHSEMGVTGLVLLRTRIVDLVGILSDHVLWGDTFDQICERDRPEAIFLPHRNYRQLNAEIRQSECIASYRRVVDQSSSPLHVREDLADSFLQCASDVHRWRR